MKDTTQWIYRKIMLEITFYGSSWVFMSPQMGVSSIIDSIVGELCLVSEWNVTT
jgi:hypothetical protein